MMPHGRASTYTIPGGAQKCVSFCGLFCGPPAGAGSGSQLSLLPENLLAIGMMGSLEVWLLLLLSFFKLTFPGLLSPALLFGCVPPCLL